MQWPPDFFTAFRLSRMRASLVLLYLGLGSLVVATPVQGEVRDSSGTELFFTPSEVTRRTVVPDGGITGPDQITQSSLIKSVTGILTTPDGQSMNLPGVTLEEKRTMLNHLKAQGIDVTSPDFVVRVEVEGHGGAKAEKYDHVTSPTCAFMSTLFSNASLFSEAEVIQNQSRAIVEDLAQGMKLTAEVYEKDMMRLSCNGQTVQEILQKEAKRAESKGFSIPDPSYQIMIRDPTAYKNGVESLTRTLNEIARRRVSRPLVKKKPTLSGPQKSISATEAGLHVDVTYSKDRCKVEDLQRMLSLATGAFARTAGGEMVAPYGENDCVGEVRWRSDVKLTEDSKKKILPKLSDSVLKKSQK